MDDEESFILRKYGHCLNCQFGNEVEEDGHWVIDCTCPPKRRKVEDTRPDWLREKIEFLQRRLLKGEG